ncbi:MAG: NAD(P)H-binding protein [Candidatus Dormibacteraeota bacterium]|nr:NAD(P)H-binding protein [Candidatus Dormibacteraeota bacterium]
MKRASEEARSGPFGRVVLVTGGTGSLGRQLVPRLRAAGWQTRVMSRHGGDVQADLRTGVGLSEAVAGVSTIIHAATSPIRQARQTDIEGTGRLLEAAAQGGVTNFVYPSIVGIERVPGYPYYQVKLAVEELIQKGRVPWTILRATQFHDLLPDRMLPALGALGVVILGRGWQIQPVDPRDVADALVAAAAAAGGRLPDFGGPEITTWDRIARDWLRAKGSRRPVLTLPLPGGFSRAVAAGGLLAPEGRLGTITWRQWLLERTNVDVPGPPLRR